MSNNLTIQPNMNFAKPNVGVVDVPKISKTPIADTLVKKEAEQKTEKPPKIKKKKNIIFRIIDILQAAIALVAVGFIGKALKDTIKKIK